MNDVFMRNQASVARYSPSAGSAFTPADVETGPKRNTIKYYR
ncbi:hypothetical protein SBC1_64330 (plasmid) [Caballeronia sp. SBC1]|nr:hypothetical protein SBC2_64050 [Caballeronia sp. SBC2]QIN66386.1 hypothetical protein SBC1_64330 [Caballeronia sp. SBC1]